MKKVIKIIVFFLLIHTIFVTFPKAEENNIQVSIDPPIIREHIPSGQKILTKNFEISLRNYKPEKISYNYYESDANFEKRVESSILKDIISIKENIGQDKVNLDLSLDTSNLSEKTYFFALEVILQSENEKSEIAGMPGLEIPIILTNDIDPKNTNPIPEIMIKPTKKTFFSDKLETQYQITNRTEKIVNFSGNLLILHDDVIIYSEKLNISDSLLKPKAIFFQSTNLKTSPIFWKIPFMGKVDIVIQATINNQRHIETEKVSVWVLPVQNIIVIILLVIIIVEILRRVFRKREHKISN